MKTHKATINSGIGVSAVDLKSETTYRSNPIERAHSNGVQISLAHGSAATAGAISIVGTPCDMSDQDIGPEVVIVSAIDITGASAPTEIYLSFGPGMTTGCSTGTVGSGAAVIAGAPKMRIGITVDTASDATTATGTIDSIEQLRVV